MREVIDFNIHLTLRDVRVECFAVVADGKTQVQYTLDGEQQDYWSELERREDANAEKQWITIVEAWALKNTDAEVIAIPLVQRGWDIDNNQPIVSSPPSHWWILKPDPDPALDRRRLNVVRPLSNARVAIQTTGT